MTARSLLVIVPDRVSDWIAKGEVVDRYFNPGDVFDHVDLLLTNRDRPDAEALQRMAGRASIAVHNLPAPRSLFVATLGWRPLLLWPYGAAGVRLARRLRPDLVRCHGARLNAYLASRIRRALGVPYVVSIHANPDADHAPGTLSPARRAARRLAHTVERAALRHADLVLPVYEPIVPYLRRLGVERYRVVYNVVGHAARPKSRWDIDRGAVRAVTVARQEAGVKDPRPLIDAVAAVAVTRRVHLHVVGDGPLHDAIVRHANRSPAPDRFTFTRSLPNDDVLALLAAADLFLYRTSMFEVSKACIEAALTALPIVVNGDEARTPPELRGDHVVLVDGSAAAYRDAIEQLVDDDDERARLGRAARAFAVTRWDPTVVEAEVASIYAEMLAAGRRATT